EASRPLLPRAVAVIRFTRRIISSAARRGKVKRRVRGRRDDTLPGPEKPASVLRPSAVRPKSPRGLGAGSAPGGPGSASGLAIKGKAYIAGMFEHPTRKADDKSLAQLHAEAAAGALGDAGLTRADVDGYFCAGDAPGLGGLSMADYMGLKVRHIDTTES